MEEGRPYPQGATLTARGVNFAVFSAHATAIELCLFDSDSREVRLPLPDRMGHVWFGHVPGLKPGQAYGFRAHGPYAPEAGHRFNPAKLLIDPYARRLDGPMVWSEVQSGDAAGRPDPRDSAAVVPRSIIVAPLPDYDGPRPQRPWSETVIYEAHLKGLTMARGDVDAPGTLAALTAPPMLKHFAELGVTAVELLPVHAFLTDRFLVERGLTNYWGYQTLAFFATHPPYLSGDGPEAFRGMVRRFHEAGIEVLLDVVFNHSCEGDGHGPTLAYRGLDNASYYRMDGAGGYLNLTGTGNSFDTDHPQMQRLILDALRYWVTKMGVDGFRFDLAATLGRRGDGYHTRAGLFDAIRQDPVLSRAKLIAEPWDIGPGGYQLGRFPHPFAEWNDSFRDTIRRFWRGDRQQAPRLADGLVGTAARFDHDDRPATSSVNFVTAHDGFTLSDVVSYTHRRNEANKEGGQDGHGHNFSESIGPEGPTNDPTIAAKRLRRMKNMLATVLLAQGTPMLLAGDEVGNSQSGNNNAYAQDNSIGWVDWSGDTDLTTYIAALTDLRKRFPVLRQTRFLHSELDAKGRPDLTWWHPAGRPMAELDWTDHDLHLVIAVLRQSATPPAGPGSMTPVTLILNAGPASSARLPPGSWAPVFSSHGRLPPITEHHIDIPECVVILLDQSGET